MPRARPFASNEITELHPAILPPPIVRSEPGSSPVGEFADEGPELAWEPEMTRREAMYLRSCHRTYYLAFKHLM